VTIRATTRASPILLVVSVLTGLAGCTPSPNPDAAQSTEAPPPVTASSSPKPTSTVGAGYVFPVRSKSARFGRTHHDYPATDIFAPCGSEAVAVTAGVVAEVSRTDTWALRENGGATRGGLSVSIVGADGVRYYGSHLKSVVSSIVPGHRVHSGELLGLVGRTGSARGTPCHLHFGISPPCATGDWWNRRGVLPPYAFLTSWQAGGQRSPVQAVADWKADHGCPTKTPKP
jgi:murein DD-endopeptidase MepM/ murein hydrolase activator NlpD